MTNEPFAYAAVAMDASESTYVTTFREQAEAACREYGWQLVPLYAGPTFTAAEREAVESGWPYPKGKMASISDAEIDALEFVVEEGRIASQMDYGVLRSLLVRLRPEWLDRPEPIKDEESDRSKPIAYTPPTHATPGECSKPREGT